MKNVCAALVCVNLIPCVVDARVVRLVVEQREVVAGGASMGSVGPYERLVGTAYFEVDPKDPLNAVIVDLDKVPKNARGLVEFSSTFFILKPVDMARGNGKIYYTVNNRGNDALFTAKTAAEIGRNGFALRLGYTIVDAGWQGDLTPNPNRLSANLPVPTQPTGLPILGKVRVEFSDREIPLDGTRAYTFPLKPAAFRPYEAADLTTAAATFTVRDAVGGARTPIAASRWAFGRCPSGQSSLVPSAVDICYFEGFRPDKLYEVIYTAKNPVVMGLGYATTRDVASFFRYEERDSAGNPNPLRSGAAAQGVKRIYATGFSQTGAYLRDFMYLGFNEDESHRKVFDGIMPTIAGTTRVFLNVRFADPNVYASQDDRHDFLWTSYAPFTFTVSTDPISGRRDGILKRPSTDPLVFQLDSSGEFWQFHASLNVVDGKGKAIPIHKNVRLYLHSSTPHGYRTGGLLVEPPARNPKCENPPTAGATAGGLDDVPQPLLMAMDEWADKGVEPPASNYPRLDNGTLVTVNEARQAFPGIPGVRFPARSNVLDVLDFGPEFSSTGGVITTQPPKTGGSYVVLVPKTDGDGLDLAGFRAMQVRVPLGTTTGWNTRAAGRRAPELCGLIGSYLPFARTKAERLASGDPRRSLEERYATHEGFVQAVEKGANELVAQRFLHPDDVEQYVAAAKSSDVLATGAKLPQSASATAPPDETKK